MGRVNGSLIVGKEVCGGLKALDETCECGFLIAVKEVWDFGRV